MNGRIERLRALEAHAGQRILVLDGAMGTMIQERRLDEAAWRGERFADWPRDLQGNNDLLNLTRPDVVGEIHADFLDAGADILTTNTFNASRISQADYGTGDLVAEINREGARIAREVADAATAATPDRPRWVAGSLGPTGRTASMSPDVEDPGARNVTFDELRESYSEAAAALIGGGVDLLLLETVFDTLNAKAAIHGLLEILEGMDEPVPLMISGTITDLSGRTLSGQTPAAFWTSVRHARPFSIGLNCSLGAEQLRPFLAEIAGLADTRVCAYPNAGLPNAMGGYDELPEATAAHLGAWARDGLVNLVGGCCGTTPAHIAAIAEAVAGVPPRRIPRPEPKMRLAGLEAVTIG